MRCAILADIHANLAALEAVLADTEVRGGADETWCLGDIVGYGPEPHRCVEVIRGRSRICVAGNHDLAAIGKIDTSDFNLAAAAAVKWTARYLTPGDREFLSTLQLKATRLDFTLVHDSRNGNT